MTFPWPFNGALKVLQLKFKGISSGADAFCARARVGVKARRAMIEVEV